MEKAQLNTSQQDLFWMQKALALAQKAAQKGEVPVGALVVSPDGLSLWAGAYNQKENWNTPLGHAELIALHRAAKKNKAWRLSGATLYVTLEPCLMCAGGILQARLGRVVFGASDPKGGAVHSLYETLSDSRLNHQTQMTGGVLQAECAKILTDFFRKRRAENRVSKK